MFLTASRQPPLFACLLPENAWATKHLSSLVECNFQRSVSCSTLGYASPRLDLM
jgi:hypothetical protein